MQEDSGNCTSGAFEVNREPALTAAKLTKLVYGYVNQNKVRQDK